MRVRNLRVRNFTSLLDIDLSDLPALVVFIGKNSSGKSNLINALDLLFETFGAQLSQDLGDIESYYHLFPNHSPSVSQPAEIAATLILTAEEWARLLDVDQVTGKSLEREEVYIEKRLLHDNGMVQWNTHTIEIGGWEVVKNGETESDILQMEFENLLTDPSISISTEIEIVLDDLLMNLAMLFESAFEVVYTTESTRDWVNRFLERPTIVADAHVGSLWELSQSRGNQRQQWTRVAQQFEEIAPNGQRPVGVASSIQMEEGTLSIPIGMTGEGSQAVLRLIDQLDRGPGVMAIEEPETHLHPALIKQVGQHLTKVTDSGKQLFVCTHSPFLIEQSSLDSFFVVKKQGSETQISSMRDISDLRTLLLDIGMRPSDVLFSDAILLVEGLSDEIFLNQLSNKIGASLAACHIKTIQVGGFPRGRRKIDFWAEVGRDAGLPLFLILDKNARDETERAIEKDLIPAGRCLVLDEGNLEDCYPWPVLDQVLSELFGVKVEAPIPVGERVQELRKYLKKNDNDKNAWKPLLAEEVVKHMKREEAEIEMEGIVGFLRKVYHEVGAV